MAAALSLSRLTTAPPAGAWPLSITVSCGSAPPVIALGEIVIDLSDGGSTVTGKDVLPELSVAVSVICVGEVTCAACT